MKLKKTFAVEVPISRQEYEAQTGKTITAVDKLAKTLGLKIALVETVEADEV